MDFSLNASLEILERTPILLRALTQDLSPVWTHNNEGNETWSVYDVIGHLLHGEKTDWMVRVRIILSGEKDKRFTPFDRFAQLKDNKQKSLTQLLNEFSEARAANINELRSLQLSAADLAITGIHPTFGEVTLSQLIATWTVHDLDHLYQISRVMAYQYREAVGPWSAYLKILRES